VSLKHDEQPEAVFAEDAEETLLSTILSAPDHAPTVYDRLAAEDFYREKHRYIW